MALQPVHGSIQRNALNIVLLNYCYGQCVQSSDIGANVYYSAVFAAIINGRPLNGLSITQFKAEQIVHVAALISSGLRTQHNPRSADSARVRLWMLRDTGSEPK